MKCDRSPCPSLLDRTLDRDLVRDPSRAYFVAFDERDPVLKRKVVDLLTVDNRDHDFIVAYDAVASSRSESQCVRTRSKDSLVIHRDDTKVALPITMANIVMTRR